MAPATSCQRQNKRRCNRRIMKVAVVTFSIADDEPTKSLMFSENIESFEVNISEQDMAFPDGRKLDIKPSPINGRKKDHRNRGNLSPDSLAAAVARYYALELHDDVCGKDSTVEHHVSYWLSLIHI